MPSKWHLEHVKTKVRVLLHNGKNTIGRHSTCRIVLKYVFMSRFHMEITVSPNKVRVRCLNAVNGVYINNLFIKDKLDSVDLREGDLISLGCPIPKENTFPAALGVFRLKNVPTVVEISSKLALMGINN